MTIKLKRGEADLKSMSCTESVKFYCSICLGTTALLSVFVFLFLIPFVVDPSITTILANFHPDPVVCTTARHDYAQGISNCTWTSCKEGCTSVTPRCHQIYVNYSKMSFEQWSKELIPIDRIKWSESNVKFFINTEGCGYPPRVNCTQFWKTYGWKTEESLQIYPCYYSRHYPRERVVAHYDWSDTLKNLFLAIGIPNVIFAVSVAILTYWYCWPASYDKTRAILDPTAYIFTTTNNKDKKYYKDMEEDDDEDYDHDGESEEDKHEKRKSV